VRGGGWGGGEEMRIHEIVDAVGQVKERRYLPGLEGGDKGLEEVGCFEEGLGC